MTLINTKSSDDDFQNAFAEEANQRLSSRFQQRQQKNYIKIIRVILVLFGAIWGIPWIESASSCVKAMGISSPGVIMLAQIGIVVAVGIDGIWVMLNMTDIIFHQQKSNLTKSSAYQKQHIFVIASIIIGMCSCIPGVYASYLFNQGSKKYLSLITLAGNLGLATFGFYSLSFEIYKRTRKQENKSDYLEMLHSKYVRVLQNQHSEQNPIIPKSINTFDQFADYINTEYENIQMQETKWKTEILFLVPLVFSIIVASSQSLIDVVLTSQFFNQKLKTPEVVAIIISAVFTIPNLVVSYFSAREVMQKILMIILRIPSNKYNYLQHFYRKTVVAIALVSLLIAITAPTAGSYITYTTLKASLNQLIAWLATCSIILARFCFSNYTCRVFMSKVISEFMKSSKNRLVEEDNIQDIFKLMEQIDQKHYTTI